MRQAGFVARSRWRQWGLKVVLLGFSLVVGFFLVEGLLRVAGMTFPVLWEPDPQIGWKHVPGARQIWREEGEGLVEINALGQRDRERILERTPGTLRIAVFGDSLTEALQVDVENSFCQVLERRLGAGERPVEVLNFGVSGYSAVQDLISLRLNGPRYRPDVAVLALFTDNDVAGCHPALNPSQGAPPYAIFEPGVEGVRFDTSRAIRSCDDYRREPNHFLRRYSCLYRLLGKWRARRQARLDAGDSDAGAASVPRRFLIYETTPGPQWEEAWATFGRIVDEFIAEARRQGIRPVILSVPAAQVVSETGWKTILDGRPAMAAREWHLDGPEERLAAILSDKEVPVVQPYRRFRERTGGEALFFGNVGHLTAAGHLLIADTLEELFESRPELLKPRTGMVREERAAVSQ